MRMFVARKSGAIVFALVASLGLFSTVSADDRNKETRSASGYSGERAEEERRDSETLVKFRRPADKIRKSGDQAAKSAQDSSDCCDYWIYDADVQLFDDFDGDGHYTYLRVNFDVDTYFTEADVYVDLYLARPDEPWDLYFESDVFTVFGASSSDEYEVETELVSGYEPGYYAVLIDVYDAVSGELVASYGPTESTALDDLPLEDISFDAVQVIISDDHGGGGAMSFIALFGLLIASWANQRRRCKS